MKKSLKFIFVIFAIFNLLTLNAQSQSQEQFLQDTTQKANAGDPAAMNLLGNLYANGANGVTKNLAEAKKWYESAAQKGYPAGNFNMGLLYERGEIVPKDINKAIEYFKLAANSGLPAAQKKLEGFTIKAEQQATPQTQVQQQQPTAPQSVNGNIGSQLAMCNGKFIAYTVFAYQLGHMEEGKSVDEVHKWADQLSGKYISQNVYELIGATEMKRYSAMIRQGVGGSPVQSRDELLKCVEFVSKLRKQGGM